MFYITKAKVDTEEIKDDGIEYKTENTTSDIKSDLKSIAIFEEPIEIGKNPFMVIYHKKDGNNENKIEAMKVGRTTVVLRTTTVSNGMQSESLVTIANCGINSDGSLG